MKREESNALSLLPGTWATNSGVQQGINLNMQRKGQLPHKDSEQGWQADQWLGQPCEQSVLHRAEKYCPKPCVNSC